MRSGPSHDPKAECPLRGGSNVGYQFIQVRHVATAVGHDPRLAKRLAEIVSEARVIVAEDADTAAREIVDAEAAFGWLGSDLLLKATKLRWLFTIASPVMGIL